MTLMRPLVLMILLLWAAGARASEPAPAEGWGGEIRFGLSAARPAMAASASLGYAGTGGEVFAWCEFNPWFSLDLLELSPGALAVGAGGEIRRRITDTLTFRHGVRVGASFLLFDTWGYPAGEPGLLAGLRLLGLEMDMGRQTVLRIDLLDFALQLYLRSPWPFPYPQHRFSIALAHRF